jgi:hypothetical protein
MSAPPQLAPPVSPPPSTARAAGTALLLLLGPLPFLIAFGQRAAEGPNREVFLGLLVGALLLTFRGLRAPGPARPGRPRLAAAVLAAAWGLLAAAVLLDSPSLGTAAALAGLAGLGLHHGSPRGYRLVPAWLLLCLALPLQAGLPDEVPAQLETGAAQLASPVLDLFGVYHRRDGRTLDLGEHSLVAADACLGPQELTAVGLATVLYVLWFRRPLVHGTVLLVSAGLATLLAGVVGVFVLAMVTAEWAIPLTHAELRLRVAPAAVAFVLVLLVSADQLVLFLVTPTDPGTADPVPLPEPEPETPLATSGPLPRRAAPSGVRPLPWGAGLAFVALGLLQFGLDRVPAARGEIRAWLNSVGMPVGRTAGDEEGGAP